MEEDKKYLISILKDIIYSDNNESILKNIKKINSSKNFENNQNFLMYIIINNRKFNFNIKKEKIINLMDYVDLKHTDLLGWNLLVYILSCNNSEDLEFNKEDLISILDRFDLNQKTKNKATIYDIVNATPFLNGIKFNNEELSELISKMDIRTLNQRGRNIFIKELSNGMCFNSENLIEQILNTKDNNIIQSVYSHIAQIKWKHEELLKFLNKNNLEITSEIFSLL